MLEKKTRRQISDQILYAFREQRKCVIKIEFVGSNAQIPLVSRRSRKKIKISSLKVCKLHGHLAVIIARI